MKWRAWLDFGTGPLGDMGCHILDPAFWALELGPPQSIEATSTHYEPNVASETYPRASIVRYTFPARGSKPPVKLTWYDGRLLPPIPPELEPGRALPGSGALLVGDKGTILHGSHGADGVRLIPETRMQEYTRPPKTLRRVTEGHEGDWIRACKEARAASRRARRSNMAPRSPRWCCSASWPSREGSAAGLGPAKLPVHEQRSGERSSRDSVQGRLDAIGSGRTEVRPYDCLRLP
jgi:hypothetical protein